MKESGKIINITRVTQGFVLCDSDVDNATVETTINKRLTAGDPLETIFSDGFVTETTVEVVKSTDVYRDVTGHNVTVGSFIAYSSKTMRIGVVTQLPFENDPLFKAGVRYFQEDGTLSRTSFIQLSNVLVLMPEQVKPEWVNTASELELDLNETVVVNERAINCADSMVMINPSDGCISYRGVDTIMSTNSTGNTVEVGSADTIDFDKRSHN